MDVAGQYGSRDLALCQRHFPPRVTGSGSGLGSSAVPIGGCGQLWPVALHRNRPSEGKTEEEGFDSWEVGTSQLALRSRRECAAHRHMMQTQGGRLDSQVVRKPMCASLKCWGNFKFRMNTCLQFVKELGWISGQQISDQTTVTGERSCGATYEFLHIADIDRKSTRLNSSHLGIS